MFPVCNLFKQDAALALAELVEQDVVEIIVDIVLRRLNGRVQFDPKSSDEVRLAILIVEGIFNLPEFDISLESTVAIFLSSDWALFSP